MQGPIVVGGGGSLTNAQFRSLYMEQTNIFGDGRHGPADLDGTITVPWATLSGSTYTMTEDALCTRIIVRSGITLVARGFRVRATKSIYIEATGKISWNGGNASGATGGVAGTAGTVGVGGVGGAGGAAGANPGSPGGATTISIPTNNVHLGGVGGAGSGTAGGAAGAATAISVTRGFIDGGPAGFAGMYDGGAGWANDSGGTGGGGGGAIAGLAGGGGGAGGAVGFLAAPSITNLNPDGITADGGNGAAGAGDGAGGGAPGGGGKVRYCGLLESGSYLPHAYAGSSGAAGGATSFPGKGGLPGVVIYMGPTPPNSYRVDVAASDCAAMVAGGILDFSGSAEMEGSAGLNGATPGTSQGGGGFWLRRNVHADASISGLFIDTTNNKASLVARGVVELSTSVLSGNPAAPTWQNFFPGDIMHYRAWFDRVNGGALSMGIRLSLNGAMGADATGVAAGAALTAVSSSVAVGTSDTAWACTASYMADSRAANVTARVVVLGDSLSAPRLLRRGLAAWLGRLGVVGPIVSVAQGGDQMGGAGGQLADWQAFTSSRGVNTVSHIVVGPMGWNDIITGAQTAVQMAARRQALSDEFAAQNPAATTWMFTNNPAHGHVSEAQQSVWVTDRDNTKGTGANPVTGIDHIIDTHIAKIGDANFVLRMRGDSSDNLHQDDVAMGIMAADAIAAGLT